MTLGAKRAVWETTIGMDAAIGIINYSSAVARREVLQRSSVHRARGGHNGRPTDVQRTPNGRGTIHLEYSFLTLEARTTKTNQPPYGDEEACPLKLWTLGV
jgi:hypothetical protein